MKGIIFNLLEEFICEKWSADVYEEILGDCALATAGTFVAPGLYPDADLFEIAGHAVERLALPLPDLLRSFGRFGFPRLAETYPVFLAGHDHAKRFLLSVDSFVHVEVRKLMPDADPPQFLCEDPATDELIVRYRSRRKLCALMEGLLDGVGTHFAQPLERRQTHCMLGGAADCVFRLRFGERAGLHG